MRGQRYEINITAKDNKYKVEILKNGWRMVAVGEDTSDNILKRLNEIYDNRLNRNVINEDTKVIERTIRAFRGYVGC